MPNTYDLSGRALPNTRYQRVAASATTTNLSTPGDGVRGRDYISHLIITAASTAAPGAVTLLDGSTNVLVHSFVAGTMTELVQTVVVDCLSETTKGFNISTGTSVSVVAVGRF